MLREHGEAIEVDLLRIGYSLPVDLGTDRLSWRQLRLLIERAPRDSEMFRALHGERAEWGSVEHLLADVYDLLGATLHQHQLINRDPKKAKPPAPDLHPRPGDKPKRRKHRTDLSPREMARRLVAMDRHG